jgi:crotonobetainyl-CoA:carnitine CoA-transferase CaiB-like acyl-CoA transferase
MLKLLGTADIFVTNVRQKSLVKMGLDYDSLSKIFPKLIYGQLSAWGRQGAMAADPGYDFGAFWAHTGVQDIIRSSDEASMPRFPGGVGDYTTGHQLYAGLMAALFQREREGVGQLVDASLLRAGIWFLSHALSQKAGGTLWSNAKSGEGTPTGGIRETTELGQRRTPITNAPFRCSDDRWIQLMGLEQARHLPATLKALGLNDRDIRLTDENGKQDWRRATIVADNIFLTKTSEEWGRVLTKHGVWWKKINRFDEMFDDDQANQAGSFVQVPGVRHKLVGNPVIMSAANHIPTKGAPKFGEDTIDVLGSLGCSPSEMKELKKLGVITYPVKK